MKRISTVYLFGSDDATLSTRLIYLIAGREGKSHREDPKLPLWYVKDIGAAVIPQRGANAPAPPQVKKVTHKQIPWMPDQLVWIAADELEKRKFEGEGQPAFTQTVKVELAKILMQAERIIIVRTNSGIHPAEDYLAYDVLPHAKNVQILQVRVPRMITGADLLDAVANGRPWRPNKERLAARRYRSEIDYVLKVNFGVGISHRFKQAKVGPLAGVRFGAIDAAMLGSAAFLGDPSLVVSRWEVETILQPEGMKDPSLMVAAFLHPQPLSGAAYPDLVKLRPMPGSRAMVRSVDHVTIRMEPPPPLTIGRMIDTLATIAPEQVTKLEDTLSHLGRVGLITSPSDGGSEYRVWSTESTMAICAALAEAQIHADLAQIAVAVTEAAAHTKGDGGTTRSVPTPAYDENLTAKIRQLSPDHRNVFSMIAGRWLETVLGAFEGEAGRVEFDCAGRTYRTDRYARIVNPGWMTGRPIPMLRPDMRPGTTWTIVETTVDSTITRKEPSFGQMFDSLTLPGVKDYWPELRIPGAVVSTPLVALRSLRHLMSMGAVRISSNRIALTKMGEQLHSFLPPIAQHPIWTANIRHAAGEALDPQTEILVRQQCHAMLKDYHKCLLEAPIILNRELWTEEKKPDKKALPPAKGGMDRTESEADVRTTDVPSARELAPR